MRRPVGTGTVPGVEGGVMVRRFRQIPVLAWVWLIVLCAVMAGVVGVLGAAHVACLTADVASSGVGEGDGCSIVQAQAWWVVPVWWVCAAGVVVAVAGLAAGWGAGAWRWVLDQRSARADNACGSR